MTTDITKHAEAMREKASADAALPDLPRAAVNYADHSYPAYSAKQMQEYARAAIAAMPAPQWLDIASAKKNRSTIWAILKDDIYPTLMPGREDLKRWNGLQLPLRHEGLADDGFDIGWMLAAPVGHGGFPDDWIAGWMPMPAAPAKEG